VLVAESLDKGSMQFVAGEEFRFLRATILCSNPAANVKKHMIAL
jgi:hypothetical protein